MLQKCEGIVIRSTDYGESNKIITIYTRELGKVGLMARGAKKPKSRLSAITQLLTYGSFLFQKTSGLGSLQQGETILSMRNIKEDIFLTAYASYIAELLDKSTENFEKNPFLFEFFKQTLQLLDEGVDPEILINIFEIKMLSVIGLHPQLDSCAVCGEKDGTFHFSIREGGFICHRCFEKDPYRLQISQNTVKLLRLFYHFDLNRLGQISVKEETKLELKNVIDAYYEEYSGLHLKSKRFLTQIDNLKGKFI
ncbi:DNA repair protein RecO [Metabacillus fastidiosus]|uniref:DNA repair protein RecO n=1 Tax=Metabacillus fastidiosus TaxID=1458 RepID=UPI002DB8F856|nr:DNA repair protein RecO [Metabacillus fastidiosus]MEC2076524.1 DNA repair protein RecO [Metabacillus fastidiosus]MED4530755.1 DNA repair protein RecO [Metabacillus fastidiosus]